MAVKLRLTRIGKKKVPFYRIVAIDSRKARDGQSLEQLGTYNACKSSIVTINTVGIEKWINLGAQMTESVSKIYKNAKKQMKTSAENVN